MVGQDVGSQPITLVFFLSVILSRTYGKESPAKLLPPPTQPITTSGYSFAFAICFCASRPTMV